MSNYNNSLYISEAIESVLRQSFLDWELIVIDDCSFDNSFSMIEKYIKDERIVFIKNAQNIGYTKNLIKGVEFSSGEIIVILDSDDALEKNALKKIFNYYSNNSSCIYLYSQCYYCNESLEKVHLGFSSNIPNGDSVIKLNNAHHIKTFKN